MSWNYICVLIDLFNREIIGYSAGHMKDATLVHRAFANVKSNLKQIQIKLLISTSLITLKKLSSLLLKIQFIIYRNVIKRVTILY